MYIEMIFHNLKLQQQKKSRLMGDPDVGIMWYGHQHNCDKYASGI